ncbi:unnamed protein product, partial [Didymodactylos carnosus]
MILVCFTISILLQFVQSQTSFNCPIKPGQINTTLRLNNLRNLFTTNKNINAYVVFSEDEHQSEYVQPYDERRPYMTGFLGSAGTAIITRNEAALWTDSRYFIQAEDELDCANWQLMKQGQPGVPLPRDWLKTVLDENTLVGVASQFASSTWWSTTSTTLKEKNITLIEVNELVDQVWTTNRPPKLTNDVTIHALQYAGEEWFNKVQKIAEMVDQANAHMYVVTALDEIAWLLNLRGSDIPYNPFFKAYAVVFANKTTALFMNETQLTSEAKQQINNNNAIYTYDTFLLTYLKSVADNPATKTVWISPIASQAIFSRIPQDKLYVKSSPVESTKAVKNSVEEQGFRDCSIRDSVARIRHLAWLDEEIGNNAIINETESASKLEDYQKEEDLFQMLSFDTISAFGANGAIVHYSPKKETAARITTEGLYLLDAGAQYLDCTTDITRTHTFGTPTDEQKLAYTLVLQGSTDLADAVFPTGTYGRNIDILARRSLYKNFMDYGHGTGHGIGHFLSVHEGPAGISMGYSARDVPLTDGMVFSDEPGFYLPEKFGIRLETDVIVK